MLSSNNEALVCRAVESIWNRGDLDLADELFSPDYVNHYGLIADVVLGPEAIKISAALHRLAFPHLCVVVEDVSTDQGIVVVRWTASRGSSGRPDGRAVAAEQESLTGVTRSRFADGRIIESWTEWDRIGVLRELRLLASS
jgi:predicted ester cyclase